MKLNGVEIPDIDVMDMDIREKIENEKEKIANKMNNMSRKRLITNRKWIAEAFSRKTVWKSRDMGSSQRNQNHSMSFQLYKF